MRSVREPAEHEFGALGQRVSAEDFRAGRIRLVGWGTVWGDNLRLERVDAG